MSKMLRTAVLALALGALAVPAFAADKSAAGSDTVVARVDGKEIHRSDVMKALSELGPQAQQMPPQTLYPQLLQRLVVTKLIAQKGYAEKLQNSKEVKDRLNMAEEQLVADAYVRKAVQPMVTEEKVKARYDELSAKYKPEDEVRARHILITVKPDAKPEEVAKAEDEAKDLIKQIKDGADFAKLATEKSKDSGSAKQGGDLGYFVASAMVKPFSDAAFGMKVGEVSDKPVKTDFGFHVIKVEDRRKSSPPPLADVKEQIMNQLGQEMAGQLVKDLQAKAKVELFNMDGTPMKAPEPAPAEAKKP